ncbi:MAG TPA: MYXO-CTERM sorting domain-containing protein, partial [Labilithrix sp.]|nr:MYXO-CTERM sorting domain-containing protein [Labilithrix sp.]
GGGGGGGQCPTGYPNDCGNNYCCPSGYTCGGSCGGPCCSGGYSGGGSGGPDTSGNHYICEAMSLPGCYSAKACAGPGRAWYEADGRTFNCSATSCASAAEAVTDYCSAREDTTGCSTTSRSANGTGMALGLAGSFAVVGLVRRRRRSGTGTSRMGAP